MCRNSWKIAALLGLTLGTAASGALVAAGDGAYTVGDLAVRLAHDLRLETQGEGPEAASAALVSAGVTIAGDLGRPLREKELTEILNQLGLHLTTSKPDRAVDEVRVNRLLELMLPPEGESASDQGNDPPGGGFGRSKSQASPKDG